MPNEKMLPMQQANAPPDAQQSDAPKNGKVFRLTSLDFTNFDELIHNSAQEYGIEYELFFSNTIGTQHGYMKVSREKVVKSIPLIELCILSSRPVFLGEVVIGYIVKYFISRPTPETEVFIPIIVLEKRKCCLKFKLPPQSNKRNDDLCERLVQTLIREKAESESPIYASAKQGWNMKTDNIAQWESRGRYPPVLHGVISKSIDLRETPVKRTRIHTDIKTEIWFNDIFEIYPKLKVLFLIRVASYMLTFASKYGVYCDQIITIKPNDRAVYSLLTALFDNVSYGCRPILTLSNSKGIEEAGNILNDAVLLIGDDTKADEEEKRENGISALHKMCFTAHGEYLQIPVVISDYASSQLRTDLFCDFSELDSSYAISPAVLTELLEYHDASLITYIEDCRGKFLEVFNQKLRVISRMIPQHIPAQRRNIYYILISTLETYDSVMGVFFAEETKLCIRDILSNYNEIGSSNSELLLTAFGNCLNEEICGGRFTFIKRTKYIVFDEATNSVIVDDDNIYIETDVIKELAISKMNLHSVNTLTDILKANDCLTINDRNSKCYRFHVQNSESEPYMLYTYGISKQLINADNRKRLDMAEYDSFLLDFNEIAQSGILPLGVTSDGHFIGKDISYKNKSNDSMFITGQSGKGKSFYATNIIASLAMLGSRILIFDVSRSFTREEVLRSLPEEVVNALFEFIYVGTGQCKLPVNPLYIGDCTNIPAKKRRIMSFIKAICKLDKDETKIIEGIISDMLKKNIKITSISVDLLCNALKRGGNVGNKVYSLIRSTLNDIELIGVEAQDWGEFFEKSKKIPVIFLGDEADDKDHTVLDILVASAFTWQRDHNNAPLSVVIDEIKMQNFSEGSPLHTILTQGRKFNTKLIGMTQQYISTGSHNIDVMKEAGIKLFFKPAKSLERIAAELEYKNLADAGFGSMGIGDFILCCEAYDKNECINSHVVIHCKTIKFVDTPLYNTFKAEYHLT